MATEKEYLAEEILVEKRIVTYRTLSRAQKIHVNLAKRALFDFHKSENGKKAGSVYATYLIYGTKVEEIQQHANSTNGATDVEMDGAHGEDDVLAEDVPALYMTLVAEENLEDTLLKYNTVEAIHVYSLSPQPIKDLQKLADASRQLRDLRGPNTASDSSKTYGTIPNSHVQRRQRKGQAPNSAASANTSAAARSTTVRKPAPISAAKPTTAPKATTAASKNSPTPFTAPGPDSIWRKQATKNEAKAAPTEDDSSDQAAIRNPPGPDSIWRKTGILKDDAKSSSESSDAPTLKKAGSSGSGGGIMQAFARGAAKPKKPQTSSLAKKKETEDTSMGLSDDGEDEDDADIMPKPQQASGDGTSSRKQREEALRKMMEEDDEEEEEKEEEADREDTPMEDADEPPAKTEPTKAEEPAEIVVTSTGDGRRRGKRRVMKKKMIEDKDGYLVTIQEPAWEEFSEDEAPTAKPAAHAGAGSGGAATPQSTSKPLKKAAPKAGQGNIMSFFAKK